LVVLFPPPPRPRFRIEVDTNGQQDEDEREAPKEPEKLVFHFEPVELFN
jgi:hypothetical protein